MSLFAFLSDSALHLRSNIVLSPADQDQGIGFADGDVYEYFNDPRMINDMRATRLQILTGGRALGNMMLYYDDDRFNMYYDVGLTHKFLMTDASSTEFGKLFNIIEAVCYTQDASRNDLDTLLSGNAGAYGIYVADSLAIGAAEAVTLATVNVSGESGPTTAENVVLRQMLSFSVTLNALVIPMTIYFDKTVFKASYPYTTITSVIYPCNPAQLLDTQFANEIDAIVGSIEYFANTVVTDIPANDPSGMYKITTQYKNSNYANPFDMPFAVTYKGVTPTAQQARDAIRIALLALNLTTEDTWKNILPDLFASSGFYIIPMWSENTSSDLDENGDNVVPGSVLLYHGIVNDKTIYDKVVQIFTELDPTAIRNELCVFKSVTSDLMLAAIPYLSNDVDHRSLAALHPTYQTVSAQADSFVLQQAATQTFNINLNDAVAVLLGGTNANASLNDEVVDNRQYISFVTAQVEYRLLKSASYPA